MQLLWPRAGDFGICDGRAAGAACTPRRRRPASATGEVDLRGRLARARPWRARRKDHWIAWFWAHRKGNRRSSEGLRDEGARAQSQPGADIVSGRSLVCIEQARRILELGGLLCGLGAVECRYGWDGERRVLCGDAPVSGNTERRTRADDR